MNEPAFYLSDKDRQDFVAMRDEFRRRSTGAGKSFYRPDHTADQTPEMFLAKTPTGGIPATEVNGTGTASDEVFGSATCTVYRVSLSGSGTGTADDDNLVEGMDQTRRVFNPTAEVIPGGSWVLIQRDKFGVWWVVEEGAGAGGDSGQETGRWALITSSSPNGYGHWTARLIDKTDGVRSLGDTIKVKLLPSAGSEFVPGVYWVTFLMMFDEDNNGSGTAGAASTEYALYDGKGNDRFTYPVCRDSAVQYDRLSIPHPIKYDENVGTV